MTLNRFFNTVRSFRTFNCRSRFSILSFFWRERSFTAFTFRTLTFWREFSAFRIFFVWRLCSCSITFCGRLRTRSFSHNFQTVLRFYNLYTRSLYFNSRSFLFRFNFFFLFRFHFRFRRFCLFNNKRFRFFNLFYRAGTYKIF